MANFGTCPIYIHRAPTQFPTDQKSYSLNQLVLQLTDDRTYDRKFLQTFITTFQSFTVPTKLLQKLMERYQVRRQRADCHCRWTLVTPL